MNPKRVYRLYVEERAGAATKQRRRMARRRRRIPSGVATRPDQFWTMDFMSDEFATDDGSAS